MRCSQRCPRQTSLRQSRAVSLRGGRAAQGQLSGIRRAGWPAWLPRWLRARAPVPLPGLPVPEQKLFKTFEVLVTWSGFGLLRETEILSSFR